MNFDTLSVPTRTDDVGLIDPAPSDTSTRLIPALLSESNTSFSSYAIVPEKSVDTLQGRFEHLVHDWMRDIRFTNSMDEIVKSKSLQSIIGLGTVAIPMILEDLQKSPKHWFYALQKVTGENPVAKKYAGNLEKMTEIWVKWGKKKGYIIE